MSNSGLIREKGDVQATGDMTDNKVLRGDGDKRIQDSGVTLDDSDNLSGVNTLAVTDAPTTRTNLGLGSISTQNSNAVSITGGTISGITDLALADGGTGASTAADARTNLGLGTIALENSPLPLAKGGTASTTAAGARTNLGLGTISTQDANTVAITGGSITGITDITVADGGTGVSANTAYAVLCGGTTATDPVQSIASVGAATEVLTSNGPGALPTFQAAAGGGGGNAYQPGILNNANYAYIGFYTGSATTSTFAVTTDRLLFIPLFVSEDITLTKIYISVTTAVAGASGRAGIYKFVNTGTFTLVKDFGTFSCAATGIQTCTSSQAVKTTDQYYLASTYDENGGAVQIAAPGGMVPVVYDVSGAVFFPKTYFYADGVSPGSALPASVAVTAFGSTPPLMLFGIS